MNKQQAYQSVRRHLRQWEQALTAVDEVHAKHGLAEKPAPDIHTLRSGTSVGASGVEEIRKAENRALRQWDELQQAVEQWNGMVLKSRPPLQEILKTLRANMPALQAEYGVTSLAVIGPYARGEDYEACQLDLMYNYNSSFTLLTQVALAEHLEDFLGVRVHLVTQFVIEERDPYLLDDAVPV